MPLYLLVPSGKSGGKGAKSTKGLQDYMHKRAKRPPPNDHPFTTGHGMKQATAQNPLPCYVTEAPQEFDEEGKELGPDAQVWKTYVREADLVDEELVDGWNKSMDMILSGFVLCYFHRVHTLSHAYLYFAHHPFRFVIESYKNLKQDPADVSSQTLLTISNTLMLIANGSQPSGTLTISETDTLVFQASAKAICVNVLWFLSLSLSVAVSLISMLAKEWCLEFMSGRTGPPRTQARRRQQRWDGLVKWRMKGLVMLLPSLIHISLLLFAIGLCVFLWDVHYGVAIPVVAVTTFAAGAYCACTVAPFLYDYCPYGTVLSRFVERSGTYQSAKRYVLFQLAKYPKLSLLANLITISSQPGQDNAMQDEVTANALSWMIINCETPRSVDIALQSLAAADENLPIAALEKCHAWAKIKQRLESGNTEKQSEPSQNGNKLYARALELYPSTRRKIDILNYGYLSLDFLLREEQLVLGIRATIQSLIDEVLLRIGPQDTATTQLLNRCAAIGQYHLSHTFSYVYDAEDTSERYRALVGPHTLAEDIINRLEQHLGGNLTLDSDMHRILSAALTFFVCCGAAESLTGQNANTGYALRLIRGDSLGSNTLPAYTSPQPTIAPYLVLTSLRLLMSPANPDEFWKYVHQPEFEVFDYLWAILMTIAHLDSSALKRLDGTYLTYGMWYLLTSPSLYNLSRNDCMAILGALNWTWSANGDATKVQSIYHAYYIYRLSHDITTMAEQDAFAPQVLIASSYLGSYSPWDDVYLLPTTEIYILTVKYLCKTSDARAIPNDTWHAYWILEYSPIPKCSPQLVQQLSSSDLITHLSRAMCSDDRSAQLFATSQLGLFFHMALHEANRHNPTLSALEAELLKYPELGNDLERQEAVSEELETKLMDPELVDECDSILQAYAYRVLEAMLQRRSTPLPQAVHDCLKDISKRLRGIGSFVNYETERSVAYPDLEFDSEGQPYLVSSPEE